MPPAVHDFLPAIKAQFRQINRQIVNITRRMNLLYIDDDPDDLEIFREVVEMINEDIELKTVSDCDDAMRMLNTKEDLPDFIFLDLNMPKMSGFECVKLLKSSKRLRTIPIIICTTSATREQRREVIQNGAQDLIIKQGTFQKMKDAIEHVLKKDYQIIYEE